MPSTSPYAEFAEILGIPQKKEKSGKESQSALLVKMCADVFLFHDRNDNIYGEKAPPDFGRGRNIVRPLQPIAASHEADPSLHRPR